MVEHSNDRKDRHVIASSNIDIFGSDKKASKQASVG